MLRGFLLSPGLDLFQLFVWKKRVVVLRGASPFAVHDDGIVAVDLLFEFLNIVSQSRSVLVLSYLSEMKTIYTETQGIELYKVPFTIERVEATIMTHDGDGGFSQSRHWLIGMSAEQDGQNLKNTYLEWLDVQFQRHIPTRTVRDFISEFGMNPQEFLIEYPYLSDVKKMVLDWVVKHSIPIYITGVYCRKTKPKGQKLFHPT